MKFTQFGRGEHRILSDAIAKALKVIGDDFGVDLRAEGGTLGNGRGTIKLGVQVRDTGAGMSARETEFRLYATTYGLHPDDFGRTFVFKGKPYKIVGLNRGAPKYNVAAERVWDRAAVNFMARHVCTMLPARAKAA